MWNRFRRWLVNAMMRGVVYSVDLHSGDEVRATRLYLPTDGADAVILYIRVGDVVDSVKRDGIERGGLS